MPKVNIKVGWILGLICLTLPLLRPGGAWPAEPEEVKTFVGHQVCQECHETEYESFTSNCKKIHSFENIKIMKKGLTEEEYRSCFECHTTGFGQPGGFVSEEETPHLALPDARFVTDREACMSKARIRMTSKAASPRKTAGSATTPSGSRPSTINRSSSGGAH